MPPPPPVVPIYSLSHVGNPRKAVIDYNKVYNVSPDIDNKLLAEYLSNVSSFSIDSVIDACCSSCITLPICINKNAVDLIFCPLLDPLFYDIFRRLPPNDLDISVCDYSTVFRINYLNITVWLRKESIFLGFVDAIKNDSVYNTSRRIEFSHDL